MDTSPTIAEPSVELLTPRCTAWGLAVSCDTAARACRDRAHQQVLWSRGLLLSIVVGLGGVVGLATIHQSVLWRVWRVRNPDQARMVAAGLVGSSAVAFSAFLGVMFPVVGTLSQQRHFIRGGKEYDHLYLRAISIDEYAKNDPEVAVNDKGIVTHLSDRVARRIGEFLSEKTRLDQMYLNATTLSLLGGKEGY